MISASEPLVSDASAPDAQSRPCNVRLHPVKWAVLGTTFGLGLLGFSLTSEHTQIAAPLTAVAVNSGALCWKDTGGTCDFFGCKSSRGATDCIQDKCLCQDGHCAGPDGTCYPQNNALVASNFTLRSAQWPDEFLFARDCSIKHGLRGALAIGAKDNGLQGKFALYQLPGGGTPAYLMTSLAFPTCTFTEFKFTKGRHALHATYLIDKEITSLGGANNAAISVNKVANAHAEVMIQSASAEGGFFSVSQDSKKNPGTMQLGHKDPGPSGSWIADPPLPLA